MRLFDGRSLEYDFHSKLTQVEARLATADEATLSDPAQVTELIDKLADAEVATLDRAKAAFPLETKAAETIVRVVIPFSGSGAYFESILSNSGARRAGPALHGEVQPTSRMDRNQEKRLILTKHFAAGTSPEDVKVWAKQQVDAIETELDKLRPAVAGHVDALRARAEAFAGERLTALRTERLLRDGLGEGI